MDKPSTGKRQKRIPSVREDDIAKNTEFLDTVEAYTRAGHDSAEIAVLVSRSRVHVKNAQRLLRNPSLAQDVRCGRLTWTTALRMIPLSQKSRR